VISRKMSQQNRSRRGGETQAILTSLFQTAKLQKKNPIETVMDRAKQTILNRNPQPDQQSKAA
jgi:hypothetical protein